MTGLATMPPLEPNLHRGLGGEAGPVNVVTPVLAKLLPNLGHWGGAVDVGAGVLKEDGEMDGDWVDVGVEEGVNDPEHDPTAGPKVGVDKNGAGATPRNTVLVGAVASTTFESVAVLYW